MHTAISIMKRRTLLRRRARAGMTLVELMLSISIMAMTGAAATTLMFTVAKGTQTDKDLREIVTKHKVLDARFAASLRESYMVLDKGDDFIVIWINDDDGSGTPNLGEIARLHYDADTDQIYNYQAPVDLADVDNTEYTLADDFDTITESLDGDPDFPDQVWATDVSAFTVTLDDEADPQSARLLTLRWTFTVNGFSDEGATSAALRN